MSEAKNEYIVYEDDKIVAALVEHPAAVGHIAITPKHKYTIFEEIPDYEIGPLFVMLNKISVSLFEALQVQGTNMLIQNGTGAGQKDTTVKIQIIPRTQHDGVHLEWVPKQLTEEQMSTIELRLKEQMKQVGIFEKEKKKPLELKPSKPEHEHHDTDDSHGDHDPHTQDYLLKQLRRIP